MTGRLRVKNGYFYAIINYKDKFGNYRQKWINSGLVERGNKKNAQRFLEEKIKSFKEDEYIEQEKPAQSSYIVFSDYISKYVDGKEKELSAATFSGYKNMLKITKKYFGSKLLLKDVTYKHIEDFYEYLRVERGVKNITVKHYRSILSPALRMAYRDDLIAKNPFEFMPKLRIEKAKMNYYNKEELENLFEITDKTRFGLIVRIAAYYGFRRSEIIGLKWDAIDFKEKTITIQHKVISVNSKLHASNTLKTDSSNRSLPLLPEIEKLLLEKKSEIEKYKQMFGRSYNTKYLEYVFVNEVGDLINPDVVSSGFTTLIKKNNLKHIRFHDLRHSCASLLVANGVPMKNIQEWLGHSNFSTTADVYSHLDFSAKIKSANIISQTLNFGDKDFEERGEDIEEKSVKEILEEMDKLQEMLNEKQKKKKQADIEM